MQSLLGHLFPFFSPSLSGTGIESVFISAEGTAMLSSNNSQVVPGKALGIFKVFLRLWESQHLCHYSSKNFNSIGSITTFCNEIESRCSEGMAFCRKGTLVLIVLFLSLMILFFSSRCSFDRQRSLILN